jgi:hypothetical protein
MSSENSWKLKIIRGLVLKTQLKTHTRFYKPNCVIYRTDSQDGYELQQQLGKVSVKHMWQSRRVRVAAAVRKGIRQTHADFHFFLSVETKRVCTQTENTEMFFCSCLETSVKIVSSTDIIELLGVRNRSILTGDVNSKFFIWNSKTWYFFAAYVGC